MTDQPTDTPSPDGGPARRSGQPGLEPRRRPLIPVAVGVCLAGGLVAGVLAASGVLTDAGSSHRGTPLVPPTVGGQPRQPAPFAEPTGQSLVRLTGALVRFKGCDDYLTYVRDRAGAMAGPYGLQPYGGNVVYGQAYTVPATGMAVDSGGGVASSAAAGGSAASGAPAASIAAPSSPAAYSQTNDQVAGVDEPDSAKTDGHIVVTLEGGTLRVMDTSAQVLGSLQLEGDTGGGLLLAGNRAVVLSSYASPGPGTTGVAQPAYGGPYPSGQPASPPTARVSVVDLSDPRSPQLVHSFLMDGSVVAARLVGGQVRLVLRSDGPRLSFSDPSMGDTATATAANKRLIAASSLNDWLPTWQIENPDGSSSARQPVTACDAVARPDQASGISTVTILSLDPQSDAPGPGASVVAAGNTVYATANHIYVAGPDQSGTDGSGTGGVAARQYGCCSIAPPPGASTRIYEFDIPNTGAATFVGAGSVPGWLVNSYAMDEDAAGYLRVASTSVEAAAPPPSPSSVPGAPLPGAMLPGVSSSPSASQAVQIRPVANSQSQITVLRPNAGRLVAVGSVSGLGKGEFLRAVRFLGSEAYVVTFESFDPLYVVDLNDPAKPFLAGELDQPGFSEFLYPLPGHRLLGVGVELSGNEPSGLVVATYDVSDPAHPRRIDSSALTQGPTYAFGGYDPHAFLYWAPANLALLAPSVGWSGYGPGSGLAAYKIGSGGGLSRAATLGHGSLNASRSLVIGSQVWVLTSAGVVTADLSDLGTTAWHPY
ncbi:MAG TPA: beta-propeller domain-containing protein [Acidimicrobiales bacterium]|nr:beta-propeller domain-containing protein [Acidimicrobiales bacterium]